MKRQTDKAGAFEAPAEPLWSVDPQALPATLDVKLQANGRTIGTSKVFLNRDRVSYRACLSSGIPIAISVPVADFEGLSVSFEQPARNEEAADLPAGRIMLRHRDESLCLTLGAYCDVEELENRWTEWADVLALPLLVVERGDVKPVFTPSAHPPLIRTPAPRRLGAYFSGRRPRFLVRRKTGRPGDFPVHREREIIARD